LFTSLLKLILGIIIFVAIVTDNISWLTFLINYYCYKNWHIIVNVLISPEILLRIWKRICHRQRLLVPCNKLLQPILWLLLYLISHWLPNIQDAGRHQRLSFPTSITPRSECRNSGLNNIDISHDICLAPYTSFILSWGGKPKHPMLILIDLSALLQILLCKKAFISVLDLYQQCYCC
jgi:hypothetical protein